MKLTTQLGEDHLERLSQGKRPLDALSELIWNALDGDATEVAVVYEQNEIGGLEAIVVLDDGAGIEHRRAQETFGKLGGSWKRTTKSSPGGRRLHGQKGEGRFGAFSLGSHATWTTDSREGSAMQRFTITGEEQPIGVFELSDPEPSEAKMTGTRVEVTHILPKVDSALSGEDVPERLTKTFALYLKQYPEARITVDGAQLDPSSLEVESSEHAFSVTAHEENAPIEATLTIVEWSPSFGREVVLCDEAGFPMHVESGGVQTPGGFNWSAYIRSDFIRECDARRVLGTALSPSLNAVLKKARARVRAHFRTRAAEMAKGLVAKWKEQEVYPYEGEPTDAVETVERQVFDVVALNLSEYLPKFEESNPKAKKLSLRMLKTALESSPHDVQRIIQEVLDLPDEKKEELGQLLEHTSLTAVINAARLVANRLDFLQGLQALLFDRDLKKHTKERAHLHRLIAENTWMFGEEFHLTVDDESLTQVLRMHKKFIGRAEQEELDPVSRLDGKGGIVDVMLSRSVPVPEGRGNEHLVVELKRPTQKLNSSVVTQIEDYAFAVASDARFRDTDTRWVFWALSNEMDERTRHKAHQKDRPPGVVLEAENYRIWVKTWGQVIEDCRSRLRLFEQKLGYMATKDRGLEYLRKTHEKYLPDEAKTVSS